MTVVPTQEADRLQALRRYAMLDTAPEPAFDRAVRMTARVLRAPLAAISLVDAERIWFKARTGFTTAEIPRAGALCEHTVQRGRTYVVADTLEPGMPAAPPGVRFYCGAPLTTPDGFCIGTLCAMDIVPRPDFGGEALAALTDLAATVMAELERRKDQLLLEAASRRLALINDILGDAGSAAGFVAAIEAAIFRLCRHTGAVYGHMWDMTRGGAVRLVGFAGAAPLDPAIRAALFSQFDAIAGASDLNFITESDAPYWVADVSETSVQDIPLLYGSYQHGMRSYVAHKLRVGQQRFALLLKYGTPRDDLAEVAGLLADIGQALRPALQRKQAEDRLALINEVLLLTGSADGFVTAVEAVMRLLCRELDAMIGMLWTRSADGQFIRLAGLSTGEGLPPECSEIVRSAFPFPVGQSLLAHLLQTGGRLAVPQVTGELAAQYPLFHFGRLHGMNSLTAESLVVGDQRCLLVFGFATQRQDLDQAADLLRDVGQAIRPALQRKQAQDQLALMNDVLARCGGAGSFAVAVESTLALLSERTDALFGMMWTRSSDDTNIRLGAIALSAGMPPAFRQLAMAQFPYPAGKSLLARLLDGEGRMVVPQLTEDMTRKYPLTRFGYEHGVRSFAAQSIAVGDTRYLLLLVYATERHDLDSVVDLTREIGQAIRPVLQRKQAQDRLSLLQAAVDAATDAVAITDAAGGGSGDYRLIYTNPAFARMSGFGPDEVQGRGVGFLRGPGTDPAAVRALDESAAAGAPARIELLNYRRDGTPFWADLSITPITGDHGEVSHWIGVTRDVTQRRADQEALQHLTTALQERTRELTDVARLARVGSWRWIDAERRFEFSDEIFDVFGVPPGSVAPTLEGFYGLLHPEDRAAAYAASERALTLGQDLLCEARIQLPDGKLRTIIWNARPIRDGAGKVVELRGYGQDITEQRDTEAALRHGEKLRTLGQLTGGIAHEFNNLLTVILANLDLASDSAALTQELRSELESARRAAIGATDLTRRLLSFARAEPLRTELTDLNTWLVPLRDMTRPILGTRYTVTLRTDPGLPPCPVDRSQLESAVLNLILNARDAMPQGGIIRIETERMDVPPGARGALADVRPGRYAVVALRDNGAGMAPSVANRAFEPFFTTKASGSGSGLGLSMVLSFARNSGGTATIESRSGKGTVVRILLPLEPQPPAEA